MTASYGNDAARHAGLMLESIVVGIDMHLRQSVRRKKQDKKRMPGIRLFVAILVSIGLVLSPIASANVLTSSASMDASRAAATTSPDKPCQCCDFAAKCVAPVCTMGCVQLAPSDPFFNIEFIGHAVLRGIVPIMHHGLSRPPPTPPPRA